MLDFQEEAKKNFEAFTAKMPEIMGSHAGKFALMQSQVIIAFFDTVGDANVAGKALFKNKPFSIQEVNNTLVNLGFFSYALP